MGAPNFTRSNASAIYAIGLENQFDDDYEFDLFLEEEAINSFAKGWYKTDELGGDNYYPRRYFAEKSRREKFGGCVLDFYIRAYAEAGYYDGAKLDYELELQVCSMNWVPAAEYENEDIIYMESKDAFAYDVKALNWCDNAGLSAMQAHNIAKFIRAKFATLKDEAEDAFKKLCQYELQVFADFGNGEVMYTQKAAS